MARVLVVDDEEADRLLLREILQGAGHDLFFARSGEEAMKAYLRSSIDVLVSDLEMPDGDGIELIDAIKGLGLPTRIVVVSGKGLDRLEAARDAGAHVCLAKPVDPAELRAAVAGDG